MTTGLPAGVCAFAHNNRSRVSSLGELPPRPVTRGRGSGQHHAIRGKQLLKVASCRAPGDVAIVQAQPTVSVVRDDEVLSSGAASTGLPSTSPLSGLLRRKPPLPRAPPPRPRPVQGASQCSPRSGRPVPATPDRDLCLAQPTSVWLLCWPSASQGSRSESSTRMRCATTDRMPPSSRAVSRRLRLTTHINSSCYGEGNVPIRIGKVVTHRRAQLPGQTIPYPPIASP